MIEWLLGAGGLGGLLFGLVGLRPRLGCALLVALAIGMVFYVGVSQQLQPDSLRSTSGLEFIFGPLWPALGAFCGWSVGAFMRSLWKDR